MDNFPSKFEKIINNNNQLIGTFNVLKKYLCLIYLFMEHESGGGQTLIGVSDQQLKIHLFGHK